MKKSELRFKTLTGCRRRNMAIFNEFKRLGIAVDDDYARFINGALAIEFCDNSLVWCAAISDGYLASTKPELTFDDVMQLIESIEPDAPEFDIKPFERVLCRQKQKTSNHNDTIWCLDFYADRLNMDNFKCISNPNAQCMIKYDGNSKFSGEFDYPAGWWECENGNPVWRTK